MFTYNQVKITVCDKNSIFSKACASGWIKEMLKSCSKSGTLEDSVQNILYYLLRKHGDFTQAELQYLGITPKIIDQPKVAATMDKEHMRIGKGRIQVQCLKTHLELEIFCVSETAWRNI